MAYLRSEYKPNRPSGDESPLSDSALDNHWKCLRAFFRWCEQRLALKRPDLMLPRIKYQSPEIQPFAEEQIKALITACERTKVAGTKDRKPFQMKRPTALRDKALLLILLDTGLRVGELTRLRIGDVNLNNGEVHVKPYGSGQKTKPRTVFLGKVARRTVWHYITLLDYQEPTDKLFTLSAGNIRLLFYRLGERANVQNVYPHRFRHTFAIQYLRNGGDVFTLQRMLGHSSLEMVRRYLAIADTDAKEAHQRASPVDNWKL